MSVLDYHRPKTKRRLLCGESVNWIENRPFQTAKYIKQCVLSFPFWVKHADFLPLEVEKQRRQEETGLRFHLDHVIPLNHPDVCGLSVPENIRVVPAGHNMTKGNKWNPYQREFPFDVHSNSEERKTKGQIPLW